MANAVSGTPLPGATSTASDKASVGPPPPPKRRSEHPAAPAATAAPATATPMPTNERRAEYVPAPPRAPVDLPKIPKLDVPDAVQASGQRGSVPPPAVAASAPPARSSSVPPPPPAPREARTTPPVGYASTEPGARSVGAFTRLGEGIRTRLPVGVQERIEGVPAVGLIVGGGALAVLLLAGAGLTARTAFRAATGAPSQGATASTDVAASTPAAAADEKSEPSTKPADAPEPKTAAAGDEATVLLDLGDQLLTQRRDSDVPPLVARLIARDPSRKDDPRVGKILLAAAASDDRKAASDSHALLTGPMGETGATLVYELSLKSGVRDGIKTRAQTWLSSKDFERVASLPVFAAQKLRAAKTCEDKHALLDFAERAGGTHVLEYLKEVDRKKACAPDDLEHCYPCMRNDNKLSDVIASLEKKL